MKRILLAAGVWAFPYSILAAFKWWSIFGRLLPAAPVVGLLCAATFLFLSGREGWGAGDTALISMTVKLLQIPAYGLFFLAGLSGIVLIQFLAVTLIVWLLDLMTITLSGMLGLAAVLRCKKEGLLTSKQAVVYSILQFVFCADVIAAVLLWRKASRGER